jgi:hypothetical protein
MTAALVEINIGTISVDDNRTSTGAEQEATAGPTPQL